MIYLERVESGYCKWYRSKLKNNVWLFQSSCGYYGESEIDSPLYKHLYNNKKRICPICGKNIRLGKLSYD